MEQPSSFVDMTFLSHVCSLDPFLYNLTQAPRVWFECLPQTLLIPGFFCSKVDSCLFNLHTSLSIFFILVYIDNIIVISYKILLQL